jgi:plasmid stabilization system protein ParE
VKARLTKRASRDLERIDDWWRKEIGSPPSTLLDELEQALRLLEGQPEAGTRYAKFHGRTVYRILLRDSQHHAYYLLDPGVVRVVTIWSTRRVRGPRFFAG